MQLFSNGQTLRESIPFQILYPPGFSEFVEEASQKAKLESSERESMLSNHFEHPDLDLKSLFHHVRDCAQPLSPSALSSVQEFVQTRQADVNRLTSSIPETLATISELCLALNRTSCQLIHYQSQLELGQYLLSAPSSPLPDDILRTIFELCSPGDEVYDHERPRKWGERKLSLAPLNLSAVCHRWRVVANSTPAIWRNVVVDTLKLGSIMLASDWIRKCHALSLTLNYIPSTKRWLKTQAVWNTLLKLMRTRASSIRLERLHVMNSYDEGSDKVLSLLLKDHQGELEELIIRYHYARQSPLDIPPSLRRLCTDKLPGSWHSGPPLARLTRLVLQNVITGNVLAFILSQCPDLQSLYVKLAWSMRRQIWTDVPTPAHITRVHHHLSYLAISNGSRYPSNPNAHPDFESLLRDIDLPALEIFEYCTEGYDDSPRPKVYESSDSESESDDYGSDGGYRIEERRRIAELNKITASKQLKWLTTRPFLSKIRRLTLDFTYPIDSAEFLTLVQSAASLEELSVSCDVTTLQAILNMLTDIRKTAHVEGTSSTLSVFKALHIRSALSMRRLRKVQGALQSFIKAWSSSLPSEGTSTPSQSTPALQLTQLDITYQPDDEPDYLVEFFDAIRQPNTSPDLIIRILRRPEYPKAASQANIPESFEVYTIPFSGVRKYEVLERDPGYDSDDDDGTRSEQGDGYDWVVKYGGIFQVRSQVFVS